ncbi:hypothetical protein [Sphingopyxis sp. MSC1_008]|jgi:hypothetical protein|uniref:hypothetical protein n=1 Tax=Sphingopyxis sp. MSC1_008 TaxID=2909265 RepID=UPI0020BE682A|nr:hypothetical protein [Sphingopyxis sp. MSC1_008]
MLKILPLLLLCTACSDVDDGRTNAGSSARSDFATQTGAPAPDYRALLKQPALVEEGVRELKVASSPPADAKSVGDTWIARLKDRGALLGYGLAGKGPDGAVELIDTGLTEREFKVWTAKRGWTVPRHIRWGFAPEMSLGAVSKAAGRGIRFWPASTARTGAQHQALYNGRIELRDGCFFVGEFGKPADRLAWFHAEIGLDIDDAGYFILRDRVTGQTLARVGEALSWSGPPSAVIDEAARTRLQNKCGSAEINIVGAPQSTERFLAQYPH